jgi:signal transduction histidine kinase
MKYSPEKKRAVITLQWLIVIVSSCLMLFGAGTLAEDFRIHFAVLVYLASALVLYALPQHVFERKFFDAMLILADTLLISAAIYLRKDAQWDLFLLFFLMLFIAAVSESLVRIVIGSVVINLTYVGFLLLQAKSAWLEPEIFIRVPFLFGVSILYGYLLESVKKEKVRAERIEQREQLRMDLVSALAHDIKNPLGVIMGYAENLADRFSGNAKEAEILEPLERIQDNAQRIVRLVTGFLDASKYEAGKNDIVQAPVQLNKMIREVAQQQMIDVTRKTLDLVLDLDERLPDVMGNESQLDRVLWNLMGNAVKFTPSGGKITVKSTCDNNQASVAFTDTGIGMAPEELPILFSQFRRLKGSAKIEGTGLGLFIVKTLVEAHKGTVEASSVEGRGSTFTIHLPIGS